MTTNREKLDRLPPGVLVDNDDWSEHITQAQINDNIIELFQEIDTDLFDDERYDKALIYLGEIMADQLRDEGDSPAFLYAAMFEQIYSGKVNPT